VAPGRPRLLRLRPSRGLGEPALEALVGSIAYVPFFRELTSSRAKGSCRSRVLRGMGARGACFTSSRPRATFSRRYPIEGCHLLGAKGSRRSRVLRGMGARGACSTSSGSRAAFSRRYPVEGCYRLEPRARAARGFCAAWVPAVPALLQAGPWRPSRADIPSRAVFVSSRGSAPLEGSPCLARDRVIKCLAVEAAVFAARARLFRRCGRARA
jgi:hypothetical protein